VPFRTGALCENGAIAWGAFLLSHSRGRPESCGADHSDEDARYVSVSGFEFAFPFVSVSGRESIVLAPEAAAAAAASVWQAEDIRR